MEFIASNILIIMFLPVWVSLILVLNASSGIMESKRLTSLLTVASTSIGLIFSLALMWNFANNSNPSVEDNFLWFSAGNLNFYVGVLLDKVSALFLVILMSVSLVVQIYSHGYMNKDKNFSRYYIYLNLFNFSMAGLILSSNLIQTYLFWELVGVSSYLLIGFWFKKYSASKAAKKAFIVNRIGDTGLLLGIIALIYMSATYLDTPGTDFLAYSNMQNIAEQIYVYVTNPVFDLICVALLMGAIAKSAQFPLHVWLADAMEAPTPISALIHAATMVAAGIFLIIRMYPMFIMSPFVMNVILYIGLFTALITAFFALTQTDIKRMLAYSTSSQLGLMFVGLGVFAPSAALFHLTTHAFYKALLFLSAGIVIKYLNNVQDMRKMGGLRKKLPFCAICYFIGCVALAGITFSGYYSKEALLSAVYQKNNVFLLSSFLLVSFMSAFYIFKSYFLVFEGSERTELIHSKIPKSMNFSVLSLAVPSVILGFLLSKGFENFINPLGLQVIELHSIKLISISLTVAFAALLMAFLVVKKNYYNNFLTNILYKLSFNKFYIDEIYSWFINKIFLNVCKLIRIFDKYIVDGFVNFVALFTRFMAWIVSKLQNGNVQTYLSYSIFLIGTVLVSIVGFYFWLYKG